MTRAPVPRVRAGLKREDGEGHTSGRFGSGGFGSVNLKGPRSPTQSGFIWREQATYIELQYDFVTGGDRTPIRLPRTYLTFYDFDMGNSQVKDPINVGSTEAMQMDPEATTAAYRKDDTELSEATTWSNYLTARFGSDRSHAQRTDPGACRCEHGAPP